MKNITLWILLLLPLLSFGQELRLTSDGLLGHDILLPQAKYHALYNSSNAFPHLRLTEDDKDYARILMESAQNPGAFWRLEGYNAVSLSESKFRFYYTDGIINGYPLVMTGEQRVGINNQEPQYTLDIRGLDNTTSGGELQLATPSETNFLRFFSGRLADRNPFLAFSDTDTFHLVTTAADWSTYNRRLSVLPDGNIGIATSQPLGKLHIMHQSHVTNPHLRLLEIGNDFARIKFENTDHPGAY